MCFQPNRCFFKILGDIIMFSSSYKGKVLLIECSKFNEYSVDLSYQLKVEGYEVTATADFCEGIGYVESRNPDIVLLCLNKPDPDGYEFLGKLRGKYTETPCLIIAKEGEELDKVRSFRLGVDDYVTHPCGFLELISRMEAILRRAGRSSHEKENWEFGNIRVDRKSRVVTKGGREVYLAPTEFNLLIALLEREGEVVTRKDLLKNVWGHSGEVTSRTVDTHIAFLRNKLEELPSSPVFIKTVPKVGYSIQTKNPDLAVKV